MKYGKSSKIQSNQNGEFMAKLLSLVLPIAFQQFMLSLVNASDAVMLGRLTQDALAAVSLAGQVAFVQNLFLAAMTIGLSVLAAQYWGKKDIQSVECIFAYVFKITVTVSALFMLMSFLFPEFLMRLFTQDKILIVYGVAYLRVVSLSYLLTGISQIFLCILKNSGKALRSSIISSVSVIANIVLNAVLIFGLFGMSVMLGIISGIVLLILAPVIPSFANLSSQSAFYLKWMLAMCSYYMIGRSVNGTTIAGIFCAGGDSRFGFFCDAVTMWCVTVPLGCLAAFVFHLPVLAVFFIINLDEIVKLSAVYLHYKKYLWVRNLTK